MKNIIGKGGMARELGSYFGSEFRMFEHQEIEDLYFLTDQPVYLAIGDGHVRKKIAESYTKLPYTTLMLGVCWGSINIGRGTLVCPGATITSDVRIGDFCIINLNASIHHDCVLGDYVTVSPSATICGNVKIDDLCFIGANAVIKEKVTICDNVIIGAGSVVINDITEPGTYVGNPVRKIK